MNDEQVFQLLTETNPVPDVDDVGLPVALRDIKERRPAMTTAKTRIPPPRQNTPEPTATERHRGVLVGAAAALIVLIAGAAMWAMTAGGDELADQPELTPVLAAYEAMNEGNVDGFYAQFTAEAIATDNQEARRLEAAMHQSTAQIGSCRVLDPSPTSGLGRVQCDVLLTNDFFDPAGIAIEFTDTFIIAENGRIDSLISQVDNRAAADSYAAAFWRWLADTHPTVFETISVAQPESIHTFSYPERMLTALEYVDEFIAQSSDYPLPTSD